MFKILASLVFVTALAQGFVAVPAMAADGGDSIADRNYKTCMAVAGIPLHSTAAQHAAYCDCVRGKMKNLTMEGPTSPLVDSSTGTTYDNHGAYQLLKSYNDACKTQVMQ